MKREAWDEAGTTLLELEQLVEALTGECSSIRRRELARTLVASARRQVSSTLARAETLDKIHRLIDELECLPTSMQRYDHQARKLAWALRKLQAQRPTLLREVRADERAVTVNFYQLGASPPQEAEASPFGEQRI